MGEEVSMAVPGCPVAVLGSGSIGVSWAIVFARAGHPVRLFDIEASTAERVTREIDTKLADLATEDLLDCTPHAVAARITVTFELPKAVTGAGLIVECVPEDLVVKQALFSQLEGLVEATAVVASSSSAIAASSSFAGCSYRNRCLVAHPANPPHILPVVELVPAPFTAPDTIETARALLTDARMSPILVHREVEGFVYNRLQGAVLREAYCLVRDGVASVADIDQVMTEGLGRRWSVVGPFETVDLNTRGGIEVHARRMGPAYARMGRERGQNDPWTPELVAEVTEARRAALPMDRWDERVRWRDRLMLALERCRRQQPAGGDA
jgi:L-gulonate 3-dehydrogenase